MSAPKNRLVSLSIWIASSLLLLLILVHVFAIYLLRGLLEEALHPQAGQGTYVGDLQLNLFAGSAKIDAINLGPPDDPYFALGSLSVNLGVSDLFSGKVVIEELRAGKGYWRVARREDGSIDTGLPDFTSESEPTEEPEQSTAVPLLLKQGKIDKFTLYYSDVNAGGEVEPIRLEHFKLRDLDLTQPNPVPFSADLAWRAATLATEGQLVLTDPPSVTASMELSAIPIGRVLNLAREPLFLEGQLTTNLHADLANQQLKVNGDLSLDKFAFIDQAMSVRLSHIAVPEYSTQLDLQDLKGHFNGRFELKQLAFNDGTNLVKLTALSIPELAVRLADAQHFDLNAKLAAEALDLSASDIKLKLATLALPDLALELSLDPGQLKARTGIELDSLTFEDKQMQASFTQLATPEVQASLEFAQPQAAQVAGQAINLQALQLKHPQAQAELAQLRTNGTWSLDLGKQQFSLSDLAIKLEQLGLAMASEKIDLNAASLALQAQDSPLTAPKLQAELGFDGLAVNAAALGEDSLEISDGQLVGVQHTPEQTQLKSLKLRQITLRGGKASMAEISLGASNISSQRLDLGELVIDSVQTRVARGADGQPQFPLAKLADERREELRDGAEKEPEPAPEPEPEQAQQNDALEAGPAIALAGFRFAGDNQIVVEDLATDPPVRRELRIERLELGAIDSAKPNQDSSLDLLIKPDKYTALKVQGQVRPFSAQPYLDLKGELSNLELALINGVAADAMGNRFIDGHIDDTFNISLAKRQLKMLNQLKLQDLEVEEIEGKDGPPIALAISLLEDKYGAINLDVPIEGDLDNPDFRVSAALNHVIFKAVAGTAALAIQPFGSVVLVGGLLADQALKVSFDPALFEPTSDQFQAGVEKQLKDLGSKLKEKPKLRVRVCGRAVDSDRTKDKQGKVIESNEQMLALADQRAEKVRKVLIDAGVVSEQLRDCRPKLELEAGLQPRTEIKL